MKAKQFTMQLQQHLILAEKRLMIKEKEINSLKISKEENIKKIRKQDKQILQLKRDLLDAEKSSSDLKEERREFDVKINRESSKNQYLVFQNEILEKQISVLAETVAKQEVNINKLIQEKKEIINSKITDYLKTNLEFHDIRLNDHFNQNFNWNYEVT